MTTSGKAIEDLIEVMNRLLAPDGCPWDREQTHESLQRYLVEESYEVIEAINSQDMNKLQEELGDLLLQVVFHAALAKREGHFDFAAVAKTVENKMIQRHPHVFAEMDLKTSNDVMDNWEDFKKKEGKNSLLEGIPKSLPALLRAVLMQEKAARVGFDWPSVDGALDKLQEEVREFCQAGNNDECAEEMGDIFFALVNIARFKDIEPEQALQACNDKFTCRFNYIEAKAKESGREIKELSLEEMDSIWDEAKARGL
ncbi:MAG: nucleoside triphosphate pyrophosphohydrolase [Syntrophomonadaceae bacterium]|nr:nucleoside triphosphate pyrophosphohydrolase [Syntrophomonadaceae bacterium]MDD3023132.1 nucleoside triphosphate pyrophosphohydrolase [Syntrophomonadaceae bacterium]